MWLQWLPGKLRQTAAYQGKSQPVPHRLHSSWSQSENYSAQVRVSQPGHNHSGITYFSFELTANDLKNECSYAQLCRATSSERVLSHWAEKAFFHPVFPPRRTNSPYFSMSWISAIISFEKFRTMGVKTSFITISTNGSKPPAFTHIPRTIPKCTSASHSCFSI